MPLSPERRGSVSRFAGNGFNLLCLVLHQESSSLEAFLTNGDLKVKSLLVISVMMAVGPFVGCKKDDVGTNTTIVAAPVFQYPTAVGTKWVYAYEYAYGSYWWVSVAGRVEKHGTRTWEVVGFSGNSTSGRCTIRATGLDTVMTKNIDTSGSHQGPIDTTVVQVDPTTFDITILQDSIITGLQAAMAYGMFAPLKFYRVISHPGDSVAVGEGYYDGRAVYVDGEGLRRYRYYHYGVSGSGGEEQLALIKMIPP